MGAAASTAGEGGEGRSSSGKRARRRRDSRAAEAMRQKMRENFRTIQVVESAGKVKASVQRMRREKRCSMTSIEENTYDVEEEEKDEDLDSSTRRKEAQVFLDKGNEFIRNKRDLKSAVVAYTKAISFLKTNYIFFNNRAAAFLLSGEYDKAISDCDASLALQENIKAHTRKASALGELGKYDSAMESITRAIKMDPQDPETLHVQQALMTLKAESLNKDTSQQFSHVQKGGEEITGMTVDDPSTSITPTEKIKLAPLANINTSLQKLQQPSSGLTFPTSGACSFEVTAVGLPDSFLANSGKVFRFKASDIGRVTGEEWTLPLLQLPTSLFNMDNSLALCHSVDHLEKELRELLVLRAGQGGVFRARNARSSAVGGMCVWKYIFPGSDLDCLACWNSLEYCHDHDWAEGDRVELLDYIPTLIMKIDRSLSRVNVSSGPKRVCRVTTFKVIARSVMHADREGGRLACFGQCGVVGDDWGALSLEADLTGSPLNDDGSLDLIGIRTDCTKLPFSVQVIPQGYGSSAAGDSAEQWQECLTDVVGPYVEVCESGLRVVAVRVSWRSTDMHMMDGLCSARAGGGVHLEIIGVTCCHKQADPQVDPA